MSSEIQQREDHWELGRLQERCDGLKSQLDTANAHIESLAERLREDEKKVDGAFVNGLKRAVEIVSLRIATPKNEAFTAAIKEALVFLGAEIERGGKPAYCVCTDAPTNEPIGEVK